MAYREWFLPAEVIPVLSVLASERGFLLVGVIAAGLEAAAKYYLFAFAEAIRRSLYEKTCAVVNYY